MYQSQFMNTESKRTEAAITPNSNSGTDISIRVEPGIYITIMNSEDPVGFLRKIVLGNPDGTEPNFTGGLTGSAIRALAAHGDVEGIEQIEHWCQQYKTAAAMVKEYVEGTREDRGDIFETIQEYLGFDPNTIPFEALQKKETEA